MSETTLDIAYRKLLDLLTVTDTSYLIIGGLAVGILGEPRMTQDIDLIISVKRSDVGKFLRDARKLGFSFNSERVQKDVSVRGSFHISYGGVPLDFIVSSTEFEKSAFMKKKEDRFVRPTGLFSDA